MNATANHVDVLVIRWTAGTRAGKTLDDDGDGEDKDMEMSRYERPTNVSGRVVRVRVGVGSFRERVLVFAPPFQLGRRPLPATFYTTTAVCHAFLFLRKVPLHNLHNDCQPPLDPHCEIPALHYPLQLM